MRLNFTKNFIFFSTAASKYFVFSKILPRLKYWSKDESGLVLVFTALVLPLILLIGVLVVQSGQLYVRQAQLQFLARQSANSSLVVMAERLQARAEDNYQSTCSVEFPPSICSSNQWTDFLSVSQSRSFANNAANVVAVSEEATNFAVTTDPKQAVTEEVVSINFPFESGDEAALVTQVVIAEPQNNWIGNVLATQNYTLTVEARSYLNLNES